MGLRHRPLYNMLAAACQAMETAAFKIPQLGFVLWARVTEGRHLHVQDTQLFWKGPRKVSPYFIPMMIANTRASRNDCNSVLLQNYHCTYRDCVAIRTQRRHWRNIKNDFATDTMIP